METLVAEVELEKLAGFTYLLRHADGYAVFNPISLDLVLVDDAKRVQDLYQRNNRDWVRSSDPLCRLLGQKRMLPFQELNDSVYIRGMTQKREKRIEIVYVVISWECNLSCAYCHVHDRNRVLPDDVIDRDSLFPILARLLETKEIKEIVFYGGEPLIHADILREIVKYVREEAGYSESVTVFTNGTLVSHQAASQMREYNVFPIVSIDGAADANDLNRHDKRNQGSYRAIERGIRNLEKQHVDYGFSLVVTNDNYERLTQNVKHLLSEFSPVDIGVSTLHQKWCHQHGDYRILEISRGMIGLLEELRQSGLYCEHLFRKLRPFIEKRIRVNECPSCGYKIILAPHNTVHYCEAFAGTGMYCCDYDDFSYSEGGYDEWFHINPFRNDRCLMCPAISICGGGCPYDAFVSGGSINAIDPYKCVFAKVVFEWAIAEVLTQYTVDVKREGFLDIDVPRRVFLSGNIDFHDRELPLRSYSESIENKIMIEGEEGPNG